MSSNRGYLTSRQRLVLLALADCWDWVEPTDVSRVMGYGPDGRHSGQTLRSLASRGLAESRYQESRNPGNEGFACLSYPREWRLTAAGKQMAEAIANGVREGGGDA